MKLLALAAALCFIGVGGLVGIRLLLLARKTRQLPEFAVGLGFVCVGLIGYPLGLMAQSPDVPLGLAKLGFAGGNLATAIGSIAIFVFTWRVFRPVEVWARVLAFSCMGVLGAIAVHSVVSTLMLEAGARPTRPFMLPQQITVAVSYLWTAIEGIRWYGLSKKRMALGLSDPQVANRFLLWGYAGLLAAGGIGVSTLRLFTAPDPLNDPVAMLAIGVAGFGSAVVIYLAFLPPRFYRRWLVATA